MIKVTGTQNGVRIYYGIRTVEIDEKGEAKWFTLPSFSPTQEGTIYWKIQVIDDHTDGDVRTTTTKVTSSEDHDRDKEDHNRDRH